MAGENRYGYYDSVSCHSFLESWRLERSIFNGQSGGCFAGIPAKSNATVLGVSLLVLDRLLGELQKLLYPVSNLSLDFTGATVKTNDLKLVIPLRPGIVCCLSLSRWPVCSLG